MLTGDFLASAFVLGVTACVMPTGGSFVRSRPVPISWRNFASLTTFPILYAICIEKSPYYKGNVAKGMVRPQRVAALSDQGNPFRIYCVLLTLSISVNDRENES